MHTTTHTSLLEGIRGGERPAWQAFARSYGPLLLAFGKRLGLSDSDAADAVQETLLAVYHHFRGLSEPFDRTKGRFKAWLRGVATHKVRDIQRRCGRHERACDQQTLELAGSAGAEPAEAVFELEWRRNLLARALAQVAAEVDPAVYQAFELYAVQGHRPEQVARLLGTTRNAVYISKTRVLKRLRAALQALQEEEG